jgi:RND family efflux transporter MFP subunit
MTKLQFSISPGLVALLAIFGLASCKKPDAQAPGGFPPPMVTVGKPEQRKITEWDEYTARVDAVETVEIRPRVTGHLAEVRFQAGQRVKKDDVLFVIDPRWHEAEYQLALANVAQATARWETTKAEATRGEELVKSKAISNEEAGTRRSAAATAEAAVRAAAAARDTAKLNLEYTLVRTPIDGVVSRPLLTTGNYVSGVAGFTTLLTTVVSDGDVFVYGSVDEARYQKFQRLVREGKIPDPRQGKVPAEVQIAGEDEFLHKGHIEHFDNRIDPATGSIVLRARVPNPEGRLVPGAFARLRIPGSEEYTALLVDEKIIGTDQSQKFLLTLGEKQTATYKPVKLGASIGGLRVIKEGISSEDRLITSGLQLVRPGMPVQPMEGPAPKTAAR